MKTLSTLILFFYIAVPLISKADSPLTSTPFSNAYKDEKVVKNAIEKGMEKKTLKNLTSKKVSSLHKICIINALGWGKEMTYRNKFQDYLLSKRKGLTKDVFDYLIEVSDDPPEETAQTKLLTADDLICWGYLQALGDYFNPKKSFRAVFLAYKRDMDNMAYGTIFALVAAQSAMDANWCNVYKLGQKMIVEPEYKNNIMNEEGQSIILEYLGLYQQDCK